MKDYELFQSFSVSEKEFDVSIHLVSEDVIYELHDVEEIQVYYKEVKNIEKLLTCMPLYVKMPSHLTLW